MKYLSTVVIATALSLMSCEHEHRIEGVSGWAERDVHAWTTALGYPGAPYTCVTNPNYMVDNAASNAYCSVVIEGRVNLVYCDGQTNQCNVEK